MIKITHKKGRYLIEYIDHYNHLDHFEDIGYKNTGSKEEIIRERIEEVKKKLEKLINDVKMSSGNKFD